MKCLILILLPCWGMGEVFFCVQGTHGCLNLCNTFSALISPKMYILFKAILIFQTPTFQFLHCYLGNNYPKSYKVKGTTQQQLEIHEHCLQGTQPSCVAFQFIIQCMLQCQYRHLAENPLHCQEFTTDLKSRDAPILLVSVPKQCTYTHFLLKCPDTYTDTYKWSQW